MSNNFDYIDDIYKRFYHIKKLLTNGECTCDIYKLKNCINCKSIVCEDCKERQCDVCKKWCCTNCVTYKSHITDPNCANLSWNTCDECKDIKMYSKYSTNWGENTDKN